MSLARGGDSASVGPRGGAKILGSNLPGTLGGMERGLGPAALLPKSWPNEVVAAAKASVWHRLGLAAVVFTFRCRSRARDIEPVWLHRFVASEQYCFPMRAYLVVHDERTCKNMPGNREPCICEATHVAPPNNQCSVSTASWGMAVFLARCS